jgi:hypothetical protein
MNTDEKINYNDAFGDRLEKCYSGAVDPVDAYLQYRKF